MMPCVKSFLLIFKKYVSAVSNDGQLRYQLLTGGQDNEAKLWLFTGILGHPSELISLL